MNTMKRLKKQCMAWKEFANYSYFKGIIPRIYKEIFKN